MDVSASNGFGTNKCVVAPNGSEKIQGGTAASIDLNNKQSISVPFIFITASK